MKGKVMKKKMHRIILAAVMLALCLFAVPAFADSQESGGAAGTVGANAAAHFHGEVTSDSYQYVDGQAADYKVTYTLDHESIHEGDYIDVQVPSDLAERVKVSVSRQHFSRTENLGSGHYRLYFGKDAGSAISGSFHIIMTAKNDSKQDQKGTVKAGDASADFTVSGKAVSDGGSGGSMDYGIRKDANGNDVISWKGYDYSEKGKNFHQIGIYDSSEDQEPVFRLLVNERKAEILHPDRQLALVHGEVLAAQTGHVRKGARRHVRRWFGRKHDMRAVLHPESDALRELRRLALVIHDGNVVHENERPDLLSLREVRILRGTRVHPCARMLIEMRPDELRERSTVEGGVDELLVELPIPPFRDRALNRSRKVGGILRRLHVRACALREERLALAVRRINANDHGRRAASARPSGRDVVQKRRLSHAGHGRDAYDALFEQPLQNPVQQVRATCD